MSDIFEAVLESIDLRALRQIAGRLGADPHKALIAVDAAVPLMLAALARNAAEPEGAAALERALRQDHADGDEARLLLARQLAARPRTAAAPSPGAAILGHVFGTRQAGAVQSVARAAGVGADEAALLLELLAPVVMRQIGRMNQQQDLGAEFIGDALEQAVHAARPDSGGSAMLLAVELIEVAPTAPAEPGEFDFSDIKPLAEGSFTRMFSGR